MTTEVMVLNRKVAGFGTLISELVRARTVPVPSAPLSGAPKNSPDEEQILRWTLLGRGRRGSIKEMARPQALFDGGKPPPKQGTTVAPGALVKTGDSATHVAQGVELGGIALFMDLYAPALEPVQTMRSSLLTVVDYRHERLANTTPFH